MAASWVYTLVFSVLLLIIAGLEIGLSLDLWLESGSDLIDPLQSHSDSFQDSLNWFVEFLIEPLTLCLVFAVMYWYRFSIGIELIFVLGFADMISNLMKVSIAFPRPCWYSSDITCTYCKKSFGDPSGHMVTTVAIYPYIVYRLRLNRWWHAPVALLAVLIGYYRMYGGMHTYSQVIFGTYVGGYITYLANMHCNSLTDYIESHRVLWGRSVRITTVWVLGGFIAAVVLYFTRDPYWEDQWSENSDVDCPEVEVDDLLLEGVFKTASGFSIFGTAAGYLIIANAGLLEPRMLWWERLTVFVTAIGVVGGFFVLAEIDLGYKAANVIFAIFLYAVQGFLSCGGILRLWLKFRRTGFEDNDAVISSEADILIPKNKQN